MLLFAATVIDRVPLPVPPLAPLNVIQSTSVSALHVQGGEFVTVICPVPPVLGNTVGLALNVNPQSIAGCMTATELPATQTVPVLAVGV